MHRNERVLAPTGACLRPLHRNRSLDLSPDQLAAARACGFTLAPATEDQASRLTAQRRIFRVEGSPFVVTRDGGFFETWATLAALIEKHRPIAPEQGSYEQEHHGTP